MPEKPLKLIHLLMNHLRNNDIFQHVILKKHLSRYCTIIVLNKNFNTVLFISILILFITLQVLLQYIVGLDLVSYKGLKIEITSLHHFDIQRLLNNQN